MMCSFGRARFARKDRSLREKGSFRMGVKSAYGNPDAATIRNDLIELCFRGRFDLPGHVHHYVSADRDA